MEKLQKALEQARADRSQVQPKAQPGIADQSNSEVTTARLQAGGPKVSAAEQSINDRWAALQPLNIDVPMLRRNRIVSYEYSQDTAAFDILRTKILLLMRKNGWKRLAITSPTAACGKSTITCNLAMGLSRQADLRAIVLEMDLRRPSLAKILGQQPPRDVTTLLDGKVDFADQALRVRDTVAIAMAKRAVSDPTRYLLNHATDAKITQIETDYAADMMIFDTPPVLMSDDTRAFLGKVDCALIVACAEKTTIGQINTCEREIAEHTNVIGVVLNQTHHFDPDGGYGYGYGSGYE